MDNNYLRALTRTEREVLDVMLSVDFDGVEELRESAERAVVTGAYGCGCPTIYS